MTHKPSRENSAAMPSFSLTPPNCVETGKTGCPAFLIQALVLFLAVYGCLFSFLLSFEIPAEIGWVAGITGLFLIVSLVVFSLRRWYIAVLLVLLLLLFFSWFQLYELIQGFTRITNQVLDMLERHSQWLFLRFETDPAASASEITQQITTACTLLFVLIGLVACFLVVRRPTTVGLMLVTAPFVCLALAFTISPPIPAFFCLVLSYLMTAVIARRASNPSKHFTTAWIANAPAQRMVSVTALLLALLTLLCSLWILPQQDYQRPAAIDQMLRTVRRLDTARLFSPSLGGLGRGDLHRLDQFRFTGEPVLKVRSGNEQQPLYLRGYSGAVYTRRSWDQLPDEEYRRLSSEFSALAPQTYFSISLSFWGRDDYSYPVSIQNLAFDSSVILMPNGTSTNVQELGNAWFIQDSMAGTPAIGGVNSYTLDVCPSYSVPDDLSSVYFHRLSEFSNLSDVYLTPLEPSDFPDASPYNDDGISFHEFLNAQNAYREYVYETYTALPEETREAAEALCERYGLQASLSMSSDASYPNLNGTYESIRRLLEERCEYSYTPSSIPEEEDFTTYFLEESREGYCVHFATAATVLLRSLGIPARYAEGLIVTQADYDTPRDENGYLTITDQRAHSWVEVYDPVLMDWLPVEVTPGYSGTDGSFTAEEETSSTQPVPEDQPPQNSESEAPVSEEPAEEESMNQNESSNTETSAVLIPLVLLGTVLVIFFFLIILRRLVLLRRRERQLTQTDANAAVLAASRWVLSALSAAGCRPPGNLDSPKQYAQYAHSVSKQFDELELKRLLELAQKAQFSNESCTEPERDFAVSFARSLVSRIFEALPAGKKLLFRYWRHLL